jgi:hypothetical protein
LPLLSYQAWFRRDIAAQLRHRNLAMGVAVFRDGYVQRAHFTPYLRHTLKMPVTFALARWKDISLFVVRNLVCWLLKAGEHSVDAGLERRIWARLLGGGLVRARA